MDLNQYEGRQGLVDPCCLRSVQSCVSGALKYHCRHSTGHLCDDAVCVTVVWRRWCLSMRLCLWAPQTCIILKLVDSFGLDSVVTEGSILSRLRLKCDGTLAETRFLLSAKRTSPFKSAGASVQSTTDSRGVRISGRNAGYTMFRGSVKGTGYPLHSQVSLSLPFPCVTCAVTFHLDCNTANNYSGPRFSSRCGSHTGFLRHCL